MSIKINRRNFLKTTGFLGATAAAGYLPATHALQASNMNAALPTQAARHRVQPRNVNLSEEAQAARFLIQATLGADYELIQEVKAKGAEGWLNEQFSQPVGKMEPLVQQHQTLFPDDFIDLQYIFDWSWWQQIMTSPDMLRQRVAFALSEIFVISRRVEFISDDTRGVANYYDLLITHAFGNFRDLLLDITLHPVMGAYLSHLHAETR